MDRGLHQLPDREYFAIDLPSASGTKALLTGTNAHLAWERDHPQEDTDAFAVGALTHALLLAPDTVEQAFIQAGKIDRRTKDGKEQYAQMQTRAERTGARIVTDDQVALAVGMADSVRAHKAFRLLDGFAKHREISVIGEVAGLPAKAKLDMADEAFTIITDIKTAASASRSEFARAAAMFGYAHQAAWYREILRSLDMRPVDICFVVVEKNAPHLVATYRLATEAIDAAAARLPDLVRRWYAVRDGDRTGYPDTIQDLDLPKWAYERTTNE
jgi:hypothetical protein